MSYSSFFPVFDLETGGLCTKGDCSPITEIAICVVDENLEDFEEFNCLVKPYDAVEKYQPAALEVSNINLKMLEEKGISPELAAKQVIDVFKRAKTKDKSKKPILVGHNIDSFDIPLLSYFLEKYNFDLSKFVETKITIDTLWWGRFAHPTSPSFKLSDCLTLEQIDIIQAHRALPDTRATKDFFVGMMKRLRREGVTSSQQIQPKFRENFKFQIKNRE